MGTICYVNVLCFASLLLVGIQAQSITVAPKNESCVIGAHPFFYVGMSSYVNSGSGQYVKLKKVLDTGEEVDVADQDTNTDPTKYNVTGRYKFYIKDADREDEGHYKMEVKGASPGTSAFDVYLTVSSPPLDVKIYWPGEESWVPVETRANLTCETSPSRPPASFRWLKDGRDITHTAINPTYSVDSEGFGISRSMLDLYMRWSDEDAEFRCLVDVPGGEGFLSMEINVAFSTGKKVCSTRAMPVLVIISILLTYM